MRVYEDITHVFSVNVSPEDEAYFSSNGITVRVRKTLRNLHAPENGSDNFYGSSWWVTARDQKGCDVSHLKCEVLDEQVFSSLRLGCETMLKARKAVMPVNS